MGLYSGYYRVLYYDKKDNKLKRSEPMRKETARDYYEIFKNAKRYPAIEVVRIV